MPDLGRPVPYTRLRRIVPGYLLRRLDQHSPGCPMHVDGEDVLQDTFLRMMFDPQAGAALSRALDEGRASGCSREELAELAAEVGRRFRSRRGTEAKSQRSRPSEAPLGDAQVGLEDRGFTSPGSEAESDEMTRLLASALRDLPKGQREAILLTQVAGKTYQEAAEILGRRIGSVKSAVNRGLTALRPGLTAAGLGLA